MKVCTLTHTYPRFEGDINAPFVEHLMEHIARLGNDVSVLTAYDPEWNRMPDDHTVDLSTYRYVWPERLHILGYSRTIEGNIRFPKRMLALSPLLFFSAFLAFTKLVIKKKPDILHAQWILPNGFIAALVSMVTGVPLLIQLHGSDVFTAEKNALFRHMTRFAASQADYIVSPSPDLVERLGRIGIDTGEFGLVHALWHTWRPVSRDARDSPSACRATPSSRNCEATRALQVRSDRPLLGYSLIGQACPGCKGRFRHP